MILVTGSHGVSTTALYLGELLRENGESTAVFTPRQSHIHGHSYEPTYDASADAVQRAIAKAKKHTSTVVMAVTPNVLRSHVLETLQCDMVVLTSPGELTDAVAALPSTFVVAPQGFATDALQVSPHQLITFGEDELAEARIRNVVLYRRGTEVEMTIDHQTNMTLSTYLLGRANAYNIAAAVAAAYLLSYDVSSFTEGIARLERVSGNLERIETDQAYSVYVDGAPTARAADLVSSSMKQIAKRRLLIACDQSFSEETLDILSARADRVTVAKGEEIAGRYHADDTRQAVEHTLRSAKKDDIVLLLGPSFATINDQTTAGEAMVRGALST